MGINQSCTSRGALLLAAADNNDVQLARAILQRTPGAAVYHSFVDRCSSMHTAAARGNAEMVMLILEAAVITEGPERAKKLCIDHANAKGETALMLACMNGHAECTEALISNGADPLARDYSKHNTCLHYAAMHGRSECVLKLLSSSALYEVGRTGVSFPIAQIPCQDDDGTSMVKFVDRRNGWGLTALHLAVVKGSVSTVRSLLRTGATLLVTSAPPGLPGCPVSCAPGATPMHLAAKYGHLGVVRALLEAQEAEGHVDLRSLRDDAGHKPVDYARAAGQSAVMLRLMDETVPPSSMRHVWIAARADRSGPSWHNVLGMLLQRLKLMLTLETIALQHAPPPAAPLIQQPASCALELPRCAAEDPAPSDVEACHDVSAAPEACHDVSAAPGPPPSSEPLKAPVRRTPDRVAKEPAAGAQPDTSRNGGAAPVPAVERDDADQGSSCVAQGTRVADRVAELDQVLGSISEVLRMLSTITGSEPGSETDAEEQQQLSSPVDLLLSSLVTPRAVAAILHAARNLVCSSALSAPSPQVPTPASPSPSCLSPPPLVAGPASLDSSSHALQLLRSALGTIHTCLQAGLDGARVDGLLPLTDLSAISMSTETSASGTHLGSPVAAERPVRGLEVRRELYMLHSGPSYPDLSDLQSNRLVPSVLSRRQLRRIRGMSAGEPPATQPRSAISTRSRRAARREQRRQERQAAIRSTHALRILLTQVCRRLPTRQQVRAAREGQMPWSSWQPERSMASSPAAAAADHPSTAAPELPRVRLSTEAPAPQLPSDELVTTSAPPPGLLHNSAMAAATAAGGQSTLGRLSQQLHLSTEERARDLEPLAATSSPLPGTLLPHLAAAPSSRLSLEAGLHSTQPADAALRALPPGAPSAPAPAGAASAFSPFAAAAAAPSTEPLTATHQHATAPTPDRQPSASAASGNVGAPQAAPTAAELAGAASAQLELYAAASIVPGEGCCEVAMQVGPEEDGSVCSICMDRAVAIQVDSCGHRMCAQCAFQMCCKGRNAPLCPFCRQPISAFKPT